MDNTKPIQIRQLRVKQARFRASGVGALMVGGNAISDNQLGELAKLQEKEKGLILHAKTQKPLAMTEKDKKTKADLIAKRDAPFELGETAKEFVKSVWRFNEYGYREVLATREIMKGHMCEDDALGLVTDVYGDFRMKNKESFKNNWFTGTPDILLPERVEDVKTCWSLKTFMNKHSLPEIYTAQAQVYMMLTGREKFSLHYCLVDTPIELILKMERQLLHHYWGDQDSPDYLEAVEQLRDNHNYSDIASMDRIKTFNLHYDEDYIKELKFRVRVARKYYKTITLNQIDAA